MNILIIGDQGVGKSRFVQAAQLAARFNLTSLPCWAPSMLTDEQRKTGVLAETNAPVTPHILAQFDWVIRPGADAGLHVWAAA